MFPSGAEEPASGSDGVSRSALFTSPAGKIIGNKYTFCTPNGQFFIWAPFALSSAGMSAGIRDVTRFLKTFDAPFDSDAAR